MHVGRVAADRRIHVEHDSTATRRRAQADYGGAGDTLNTLGQDTVRATRLVSAAREAAIAVGTGIHPDIPFHIIDVPFLLLKTERLS